MTLVGAHDEADRPGVEHTEQRTLIRTRREDQRAYKADQEADPRNGERKPRPRFDAPPAIPERPVPHRHHERQDRDERQQQAEQDVYH